MTPWRGGLAFRGSGAIYRGVIGHHAEHAHLALQMVTSSDTSGAIYSRGAETALPSHSSFLIGSRVPHRIKYQGSIRLCFIDSASTLGLRLRALAVEDVAPVTRDVANEIALELEQSGGGALTGGHFSAVLGPLEADPTLKLSDIARSLGLSPSALRRLARSDLGSSLASWRLWRKLERACRAIADGTSLAEAAITGGFSDQAHFSRTMRNMFGISPSQASAALQADLEQPRARVE